MYRLALIPALPCATVLLAACAHSQVCDLPAGPPIRETSQVVVTSAARADMPSAAALATGHSTTGSNVAWARFEAGGVRPSTAGEAGAPIRTLQAAAPPSPEAPAEARGGQAPSESGVETGADPSRLLRRFELNSQYLEVAGPSWSLAQVLKLDVPITKDVAVAFELPLLTQALPQPLDTVFGTGDAFIRVRRVWNTPRLSWIAGVEFALDTASGDALGAGKWQVNPTVANVYRFTPQWMLASALKQRLSVAGDDDRADLNRTELRLIGIHLDPRGRWALLDYQPRVDWNDDGALGHVLELELGTMLSKDFGVSIRAGTALGEHQDRDYSLQLGFRFFF